MKKKPINLLNRKLSNEFPDCDSRGSLMRCLQMTTGAPVTVSAALSEIISGYGTISATDTWAPHGFPQPKEARLDETVGFLKSNDQKQALKTWWISEKIRGARTPPWDIASTCSIGGRKGLMLVEAKAHQGEMSSDHCSAKEKQNIEQIRIALTEATEKWNDLLCGLATEQGYKMKYLLKLGSDCHYELSSRLAWALKVAEMGIPVILVYLGFLDALEIEEIKGGIIFRCEEDWRNTVLAKTKKPIPEELWDHTFSVNGTPLTVLIRTTTVELPYEEP